MVFEYNGLEVIAGWVNREHFGIVPLTAPKAPGCLYGIEAFVKEYTDGSLTPTIRQYIHRHADTCDRCHNGLSAHLQEFEDSNASWEDDPNSE